LLTWGCDVVAKIDAVQAEYSAFETVHETNGLIDTARELGVAYVAYSPLGRGWLVDDFPYKTPDDFAPDDFRRTGKEGPRSLHLHTFSRSSEIAMS
jgi:aryl-alcohol dehydrogenase-like predicted oxidoreductase